jgi:nucleoside-diphosphate-sugar epimerase
MGSQARQIGQQVPMRLFITGATGYIGRVVTDFAVKDGYVVYGLSRSEQGDKVLQNLGAKPIRGHLKSLDVLREQTSLADVVLHLAYIHDLSMDYEETLRVDTMAVKALGDAIKGSCKSLIIASVSGPVKSDPKGGETSEDSPLSEVFAMKERMRSELNALSLVQQGVHVLAIRLPPYVYGRAGSIFIPTMMQIALKAGESICVGDGRLRTSSVHVDDAARLFLILAKKHNKIKSGEVFNATDSTSIRLGEIATAVGSVLNLPVRSVTRQEAEGIWGQFLTSFVQSECRASSAKAFIQLGWQPREVDLLRDVQYGSYVQLAQQMKENDYER